MILTFICDSHFQKKVSLAFTHGDVHSHKIIAITADEFLQSGKLPEGTQGILVERGTWQKNFALFRYFNLLPLLEGRPLGFVVNASIAGVPVGEADFKGRLALKGRDFVLSSNIGLDELALQINKFAELPVPTYSHPKSRAVA
ncbi:hypothetical protein AGMMS49938_09220 [Fibrobacterales bacterium]|nr:hypothetical protein AGMMS49938_09220 [Fibrobacterales bacterium]